MAQGKVEIDVTADTSGAKRSVDEFGSSAKGSIESKLDGAGSKAMGGLKALGGAAMKAVAAGAVAAGAAVAGIGASALKSYAEYEQLVGGVDTLFGSASQKLQGYAAEAYRTAGMSANQYMQQATSFSASLVQGLKADGRSMADVYSMAADSANTAMTDMADNVNKMGSSMTDVQNAYQGFAKDNYTMLDNLKLGYGGTQAEMARLINDSGVLGDTIVDANSVSSVSFDKIIEAIHVTQERMGIAGTTTAEAMGTIQGSIAMTQAAWENWLVGIADPSADMGALTEQLLTSIGAVAQNVVPRVMEIGAAIVENLPAALSGVGETLAPVLADALASAWNQAVLGLSSLGLQLPAVSTDQVMQSFQGLKDAAQSLSDTLGPLIQQIGSAVQPVIDGIMTGLSDGLAGVQPYLDPFVQSLSDFVSAVAPGLQAFGDFLAGAIPVVISGVVQLATIVVTGMSQIITFVTEVVTAVYNFFTVTIPEAITSAITFFSQLPANISAFLSQVISSVSAWVGSMVSGAVQAGSQFVSSVVSFFTGLPGQIGGFLGNVIGRVSSWVGEMASNAARAASDFGRSLMDGLASIPGRVGDIGRQIIQGIADGVRGAAGSVVSAVTGAVGGAIEAAKKALGIASPSKVFRREVGHWIPLGAAEGVDEEAGALADSVARMSALAIEAASVEVGAPELAYRVEGAAAGTDVSPVVSAVEALSARVAGLQDALGPTIAAYAPQFPTSRQMGRLVNSYVS